MGLILLDRISRLRPKIIFDSTSEAIQFGGETVNRRILITGASRGIGHAVARTALERGDTVIGTSTTPVGVTQLQDDFKEYQDRLTVLMLDLGSPASIEHCCEEIAQGLGYLDVLVNNAGRARAMGAQVIDHTQADVDDLFATNLVGPFNLCRHLIPSLAAGHEPCIINVTGALGRFATDMIGGGAAAYRMTKAGINVLTRVLSEELRVQGIRVFAFDPGWVRTDLGGPDAPRCPEEVAAELIMLLDLPAALSGYCLKDGRVCAW